ncbi:MAG: hypothetical protein EA420_11785 [Candidatus Competibacteraceae bacterium]|nr:MAG: hypothetical protein EA420_11785 [Candidatus Competibacteraceae bacterium]
MNLTQFNLAPAEIRDDRTHGASELARRCLLILTEAACTQPVGSVAKLGEQLLALNAELARTRPSRHPPNWMRRTGRG